LVLDMLADSSILYKHSAIAANLVSGERNKAFSCFGSFIFVGCNLE